MKKNARIGSASRTQLKWASRKTILKTTINTHTHTQTQKQAKKNYPDVSNHLEL